MVDDIDAEKKYPTYIINRCLSSFTDTVLFANEMNKNPHLPKRLQYDFYINSVKPRKKFSPWTKKDYIDYLEIVNEYYGYNNQKAHQALALLTPEQIVTLRKKVNKGGRK